jgi:hypothetical protein
VTPGPGRRPTWLTPRRLVLACALALAALVASLLLQRDPSSSVECRDALREASRGEAYAERIRRLCDP